MYSFKGILGDTWSCTEKLSLSLIKKNKTKQTKNERNKKMTPPYHEKNLLITLRKCVKQCLFLKDSWELPFSPQIFFWFFWPSIRCRDQITDAKGLKGSSSVPKTQIAMWSWIKSKWQVLYRAGSRIQKHPESYHIKHTHAHMVPKPFSLTDF